MKYVKKYALIIVTTFVFCFSLVSATTVDSNLSTNQWETEAIENNRPENNTNNNTAHNL